MKRYDAPRDILSWSPEIWNDPETPRSVRNISHNVNTFWKQEPKYCLQFENTYILAIKIVTRTRSKQI